MAAGNKSLVTEKSSGTVTSNSNSEIRHLFKIQSGPSFWFFPNENFVFELNLSLINSLSLKRRLFLSKLIAISINSKFIWFIARTNWLKALCMLAFFVWSPNPDRLFRTSCRTSFWILLKSFFGLEFRWMKWISSMSLIPSTNLSTNQSGRFDFCFDDWRTYAVLKLDCL